MRKYTHEERVKTFWNNVKLPERIGTDECWEWQGHCVPNGYGSLRVNGKDTGTHRFAYTISVGPIPDGLFVLHTCDNPPCCNPAHLWLGTNQDNMDDMARKDRRKNGDGGKSYFHDHPETRRGERNSRAKLTDDDVRRIRELYTQGMTQVELGQMFGVNQTNIGRAIRRWKHVR